MPICINTYNSKHMGIYMYESVNTYIFKYIHM